MSIYLAQGFTVQACCYADCGISFALTTAEDHRLQQTREWFYCPHGHRQHYTGKSDAEKLKAAQAREVALNDQLRAAVRDAEESRSLMMRDRHRFANGICPCCRRTFDNVRRHMATQHPDYDVAQVAHKAVTLRCSCGREFDTYRGLRTHQGWSRQDGWDKPDAPSWRAHLTAGASR